MKLIFIILFVSSTSFAEAIFSDSDHCVAWKTKKTLGLVKTVEPVGKNCSIESELIQNKAGELAFSGKFPVAKFDSGEEDRDAEVQVILNAKKFANVEFTSETIPPTAWKKILNDGKGTISGTLMVAGKKRLIDPELNVEKVGENFKIKGTLKTKFTYFGIEPPTIAGGLVASVKDQLEFHFQFLTSKLKGFEHVK